MDKPLSFTIVTVSYNNIDTIGDTIRSVLNQDYPFFEYRVIDGGSTDGTVELLSSFGNRIKWTSEPDDGIYDAMNKGWRAAENEMVAYLNADDFYASPRVLSLVAKAFDSVSQAAAVYGDLAYVKYAEPQRIVRYWKSGAYSPDSFLWGWMPPHPTFFLQKSAFEQFGGFRKDDLQSAADYELILRMLYKNEIVAAYCPHLLVYMRTGGESNRTLKNRVRGNREDRRAWELNGLKPLLFTLWLKPLRKVIQYFIRP